MKPCILLVIAAFALSGCISTDSKISSRAAEKQHPNLVKNAIISEPLHIDYKSELAIARLTQLLIQTKLDKEELAQKLYDRGVIYDSLGLRTLAHIDFRRVLEVQPTHAEAYNFIGIHMTLNGQYEKAFDAFDSAEELAPEHGYVNLNRGIALHYFGRHQLAVQDIETFHLKNTSDPYRAIWLYLAEAKMNQEDARLRLLYNSTLLDKSDWAFQIIQMILGELDEETFIKQMGDNLSSPTKLVERLCEGYFYLAKMNLLKGDRVKAKNYFRLSLATNVYEFVEHKYARLELYNLYKQEFEAEKVSDTSADAPNIE